MLMPKNDETSSPDRTRTGSRRWLAALRGKTLRFKFEEGPTAGTSYDHAFSDDGTVTWQDPAAANAGESSEQGAAKEPPTKYGSFQVTDDVYVVSYLSKSGYTLTVALNFETDELFGFASNDENWYPVRGVFEVLE
jgi:hypothetical protein